jgi:hypothetical protein
MTMKKLKCCATVNGAGQIVRALADGATPCQSDATGAFKRSNTLNPSCEAHKEALAAFLGVGFSWVSPAR